MRHNRHGFEVDESIASVRAGQGLLTSLLRCGRCGRRLHVQYWGKRGTRPRYLCRGELDTGGKHCLSVGGSVDRRFADELLRVISLLGIRASLEALEARQHAGDERREALHLQMRQLRYEATRAFEKYDEVDPRNRLVANDLEARWNRKLEELETVQAAIDDLDSEVELPTAEERDTILALGERFDRVWHSAHCPMELKKKILRTVTEEVIVDLDDETQMLSFVIHWKEGRTPASACRGREAGPARRPRTTTSRSFARWPRSTVTPRSPTCSIASVVERARASGGISSGWRAPAVRIPSEVNARHSTIPRS